MDNVGNVIQSAAPIHASNEYLPRRRQNRRFRRRATVSGLDDLPRNEDEAARDGFIAQNQVLRFRQPPFDMSLKNQMKVNMGDVSLFRRVKQIDWAKAVSQVPPDPQKSIQVYKLY